MNDKIFRDQGDTAPGITVQLLVNGSPFSLAGASVVGIVGGTVGSGPGAAYQRFVLPATWAVASMGDASVTIPLNPSGLAPAQYPAASPAALAFEIRGVASGGGVYQWPQRAAIDFIVRKSL